MFIKVEERLEAYKEIKKKLLGWIFFTVILTSIQDFYVTFDSNRPIMMI